MEDGLRALTGMIIDAGLKVHRTLGPGLLETVYEQCLAYELTQRGISIQRQVALPVIYEGLRLEAGFRIDLLAEGQVIIEVKSTETLTRVHQANF